VIEGSVVREPESRLVYSTAGEPLAAETEQTEPAERSGKGIRLRLERRASGRLVTVVTGLPGPPAALADLARQLKVACGAGGAIKQGDLELQGDHRERIETLLKARGLRSKRAGG
jgi:translation initiation factor 1